MTVSLPEAPEVVVPTRQLASTLALGLYRLAALASWHILVPPDFEMCSSSRAGRWAREQLRARAKEVTTWDEA